MGAAVAMVAAPEVAGAASGDNMVLGQSNTATDMTTLTYDNTLGTAAVSALLVQMTHGTGWGLTAAGINQADVKLSGTGRLQFWAHGASGAAQPTFSPGINEINMSDTGVLWAGEATGQTWRRINTLRVDRGDGSGTPFAPFRLYDSRTHGHAALSAGGTVNIPVAGLNFVPANAIAVLGTITAVAVGSKYKAAGGITLYPTGAPRPSIPNVHYTVGSNNLTNFFICGVEGGDVTVYSNKQTHFTIDIVAYLQ